MSDRATRFSEILAATRLCAITDQSPSDERMLQIVDRLLDAGVRLIQYRDKARSDGGRVVLGRALATLIHARGGLLIVNDRVDVALACGADGAHLGQDDLPLDAGRRILGPDLLLGASASYAEEIPAIVAAGADYIGFGAVFPTETKPDAEYAGLDLLRTVVHSTALPVIGIGGITEARAPTVLAQGATGVAVVSALFGAPDPGLAATRLLRALSRSSS
ncbi:MAG TPA: thiamine phosphate synthase [Chloroflexota bacterium]|nr:thiamine phosphate synthase [Chloroflexota bacterium]